MLFSQNISNTMDCIIDFEIEKPGLTLIKCRYYVVIGCHFEMYIFCQTSLMSYYNFLPAAKKVSVIKHESQMTQRK